MPATNRHEVSRFRRLAAWMPEWMGSLRFRITLIYSTVLFGLAALVVAGIYMSVSRSLEGRAITNDFEVVVPGETTGIFERNNPGEQIAIEMERQIDRRTLETLREYSFGALGMLFITSLGVGWMVAGRILRPLDRITSVAQEIQATDLSRRISLDGPDDELKELADTFDAMLARLDGAFEDQRTFIHETSHELRNPLAVMRTNLEVALNDPNADASDMRDTAKVVQKSAERMSRLVDDLLLYARRESRHEVAELVDVQALVAGAVDEFRAVAETRGMTLAAATGQNLWVEGDRVALGRALANLLANAVRLAPENSRIRVTAGEEDHRVWMAVSDEGPGIAPEDHPRVFQRFWKGDPAGGRARSGLGLAIVRQIAEGHRGEVRLASEVGRGSVFSIWIPALPQERRPQPTHPAMTGAHQPPLSERTVELAVADSTSRIRRPRRIGPTRRRRRGAPDYSPFSSPQTAPTEAVDPSGPVPQTSESNQPAPQPAVTARFTPPTDPGSGWAQPGVAAAPPGAAAPSYSPPAYTPPPPPAPPTPSAAVRSTHSASSSPAPVGDSAVGGNGVGDAAAAVHGDWLDDDVTAAEMADQGGGGLSDGDDGPSVSTPIDPESFDEIWGR